MKSAGLLYRLSSCPSFFFAGRSSGSVLSHLSFSDAGSPCVESLSQTSRLVCPSRQQQAVFLQQQTQQQQQRLSFRQRWPQRQRPTPRTAHSSRCSSILQRTVCGRKHAHTPVAGAAFSSDATENKKVEVIFVMPDGTEKPVGARVGETLLEVAHAHGIELEGACEGQCSCSTCHVILEAEVYEELPEPSEQEEDMLDMAACLTST